MSARTTMTALRLASVAVLASACTLDFDALSEPVGSTDLNVLDDSTMPTDAVVSDFGPRLDFGMPDLGMDAAVGDTDGDGVLDGADNCLAVPNPDQADTDGDGVGDACGDDPDGDGVSAAVDNCADVANPDQLDLDRDGAGNACDDDADGDDVTTAEEAARGSDPLLADTDGDGLTDGADSCPRAADPVGSNHNDTPAGDACDPDDDGDGVADWLDNCPATVNADQADADADGRGDACAADADGDGVPDATDTCPQFANPDQAVAPCRGGFAVVTYDRDARALSRSGSSVVAATRGGLLQVAPEFRRVTNAQGLAENDLNGVFIDAAGRRFVTSNTGLTVSRPDGFAFTFSPTDAGGGPRGALRDVVTDPADNLWVSSDEGLNVLAGGTWTLWPSTASVGFGWRRRAAWSGSRTASPSARSRASRG